MASISKCIIFLFLLMIQTTFQNKILEHFEEKLNSINDRLKYTRTTLYKGKIKRYRCIEEYVNIDEYGHVIEDSENGGRIFTTRQPPAGYEQVTQLPKINNSQDGVSHIKHKSRAHGVKTMSNSRIPVSFTYPLKTKMKKKKKKLSKSSKSKLRKVEIKKFKSYSTSKTVTLAPLTSTITSTILKSPMQDPEIDDESGNDRLIELLYLSNTTQTKTTARPMTRKSLPTSEALKIVSPLTTMKPTADTSFVESNPEIASSSRSAIDNYFLKRNFPPGFMGKTTLSFNKHRNTFSNKKTDIYDFDNHKEIYDKLYVDDIQDRRYSPASYKKVSPMYHTSEISEMPQKIVDAESDKKLLIKGKYFPPNTKMHWKQHLQPINVDGEFNKPAISSSYVPLRVEPQIIRKKEKIPLPLAASDQKPHSNRHVPNPLSPHYALRTTSSPHLSDATLTPLSRMATSPRPYQQAQSMTSTAMMEKASSENCARIPIIASQFGITDISAWARNNCVMLQMFAPGATCQQIWHFIDSCKQERFI